MFVTQLVFASFLYVIVYFLAPVFASFFDSVDQGQLVAIIRVMALTMPLGALSGVQSSVVTRRLMFNGIFIPIS